MITLSAIFFIKQHLHCSFPKLKTWRSCSGVAPKPKHLCATDAEDCAFVSHTLYVLGYVVVIFSFNWFTNRKPRFDTNPISAFWAKDIIKFFYLEIMHIVKCVVYNRIAH